MQYREDASERARARITEGAKVCFYRLLIKLFSFAFVLTYCWCVGGVGVGPVLLLLLLGSAVVCGGGLISDSLKKRERKLLQNSHCLLKQTVWRLSVGWKCFLAIKEASQFCLTFNLEWSFKKVCTCWFKIGGDALRAPVAGRRPLRSRRFHWIITSVKFVL